MLIEDHSIKDSVAAGDITIEPYEPKHMQPASYDIHLGENILLPNRPAVTSTAAMRTHIDPGSIPIDLMTEKRLPTRNERARFWMSPGECLLGHTVENLTLHPTASIAADIAGISSLGRLFLIVHCTAGFIDPGWTGQLTLEIFNASPWFIRLWQGMRIGQLRFYEMIGPSEHPYGGASHYQNSEGVVPSRYDATH